LNQEIPYLKDHSVTQNSPLSIIACAFSRPKLSVSSVLFCGEKPVLCDHWPTTCARGSRACCVFYGSMVGMSVSFLYVFMYFLKYCFFKRVGKGKGIFEFMQILTEEKDIVLNFIKKT
jgi:hypothetical protein